jgi:hypothetical protein
LELQRSPSGEIRNRPPVVGVEERREDARRVKAWVAVPVDRPVGADEGDGVQVADQAVLGDGQVARPRYLPNSAGHDLPSWTSPALARHRRAFRWAHGTRTGFPTEADCSSSSCARRAWDSGRRSATTGWILSAPAAPAAPGSPPGTTPRCGDLPPPQAPGDVYSPEAPGGPRAASGSGRPAPAGEATAAPEPDAAGRVPLHPPAPARTPLRQR